MQSPLDGPHPPALPPTRGITKVGVALSFLMLVPWVSVHVAWAYLTFMASAIINVSEHTPEIRRVQSIPTLLAGIAVCALAGVPGTLACFWTGRRRQLGILFALMFVVGVAMQVAGGRGPFYRW